MLTYAYIQVTSSNAELPLAIYICWAGLRMSVMLGLFLTAAYFVEHLASDLWTVLGQSQDVCYVGAVPHCCIFC
jgi:hypothetical protein